jgi:hypothetical protein
VELFDPKIFDSKIFNTGKRHIFDPKIFDFKIFDTGIKVPEPIPIRINADGAGRAIHKSGKLFVEVSLVIPSFMMNISSGQISVEGKINEDEELLKILMSI